MNTISILVSPPIRSQDTLSCSFGTEQNFAFTALNTARAELDDELVQATVADAQTQP